MFTQIYMYTHITTYFSEIKLIVEFIYLKYKNPCLQNTNNLYIYYNNLE